MPATLELLGRHPITYESASKKESNVINQLDYVPAIKQLYHDLWRQRHSIAALTKHHLGLGGQDICTVPEPSQWIRGNFNVCIPVEVQSSRLSRKLMFRCPMPHKLAEAKYAGTVNEKLRCEVATHVWMQDKCSDIRIPHLYGFGFLDGYHFTHASHRLLYIRIAQTIRRYIHRLLQWPMLSKYTHHDPTGLHLSSAYMVLEYIGPDTGEVLSNTWREHMDDDSDRRQRLFHGIAQIMLSLARIPQPRIGSFRFNDDGAITLTNRALSCSLMILENDGTTRTIQSSDTFNSSDTFVSEMLTFHDHRFLSQPNAVFTESDCRGQMAVKTVLRAISHRYIKREYRQGPFLLQLTDLHPSNIFVDQQWNITCLIDLEWICSLPAEMIRVPYWLTGLSIDDIQDERYVEFDKVRQEFLSILEQMEHKTTAEHSIQVSQVMKDMWHSRGVWFWHCISSVNAMYFLLEQHLCSLSLEAERAVSVFWSQDSEDVVRRKLADKKEYDDRLGLLFGERGAEETEC